MSVVFTFLVPPGDSPDGTWDLASVMQDSKCSLSGVQLTAQERPASGTRGPDLVRAFKEPGAPWGSVDVEINDSPCPRGSQSLMGRWACQGDKPPSVLWEVQSLFRADTLLHIPYKARKLNGGSISQWWGNSCRPEPPE